VACSDAYPIPGIIAGLPEQVNFIGICKNERSAGTAAEVSMVPCSGLILRHQYSDAVPGQKGGNQPAKHSSQTATDVGQSCKTDPTAKDEDACRNQQTCRNACKNHSECHTLTLRASTLP
jgi:hypothetical protein